MENTKNLLLTVSDAATALSVSDFTVRRAIWRGDLRSVRIGRVVRVRYDDLSAFVDANTERCGEPKGKATGKAGMNR